MTECEVEPLLSVRNLSVSYYRGLRRRSIEVVTDVSFNIYAGHTLGLVGESGSGKTSIGRAIVGLVPVGRGYVGFGGEDIGGATRARRRQLTEKIQMVFQDPYGSLNPSRTLGQTLSEPLLAHRRLRRSEVIAAVGDVLTRVGLSAEAAGRYPHAFSGGQRQRAAIARALIVSPRLIVCDEPVTSLDVSAQAQVLNLLRDIQSELAIAYLFISHDLDVIRYMAEDIAVLQRGRIVELGASEKVSSHPEHPYTRTLIAAVPRSWEAVITEKSKADIRSKNGNTGITLGMALDQEKQDEQSGRASSVGS